MAFVVTSSSLRRSQAQFKKTICAHHAREDSPAPPESRIHPNFASSTRFLAPRISTTNSMEFPLANTLGVVMEAPELDFHAAASIRAEYAHMAISKYGAYAALFTEPTMNPEAVSAADEYFPLSRRYEVPVIDFDLEDPEQPSFTVSRGKAFVDDTLTDDGEDSAQSSDAQAVVDLKFPGFRRNRAPVITFDSGQLGVKVQMMEIQGCPSTPLYESAFPAETRFMAPKIDLKAPKGDWDQSGYVSLKMEEIQLNMNP
mmetsp:Transcript_16036/g.39660  ORF Transcript_16036/g.39660 Transcript_16036/m.39660 type:complete len:257 (-) Transcript_16036:273-1043(-)